MAHAFVTPRDPTQVLGRRAVAFLIDGVLLAIVGWILTAMVKHTSYYGAPSGACANVTAGSPSLCFQIGNHLYVWDRGSLFRSEAIAAVVAYLDLVVLQALTGASLGKLGVGLRVVDARGRKANVPRMFGRWLLLVVDAGCLLVGVITTVATHPHRRVGDIVCGTYVVSRVSLGQPIGAFRYSAPAFVAAAPMGPASSVSTPAPVQAMPMNIAPPPVAPKPSPAAPQPTSTLTADASSLWAEPPAPKPRKPAAKKAAVKKPAAKKPRSPKSPPQGKTGWTPAVEVTPPPRPPKPPEPEGR